MATIKDVSVNNYCDAVSNELAAMKAKINELREDVKRVYGAGNELTLTHERHLCELEDFIDWKLQILMKVCPMDWKGLDKDIETTVSVEPVEKMPEADFSGGYIGG